MFSKDSKVFCNRVIRVAIFASTSGWRQRRPTCGALGECAGSPQFTHVAEDDFRIVIDNIAGGKRSTRDRLVPYCMFTDPPLAHVGLSEAEAERQSIPRASGGWRRAPCCGRRRSARCMA